MITFKQFVHLNEADQGLLPIDLFVGRFQPFHLGHLKTVEMMHNPIIAIVRGAKTSTDKETNPLLFEDQRTLINTALPNVPVLSVPTGYLPDIIISLKPMGYDVRRVFAGEDRTSSYQAQLERHNRKAVMDSNIPTVTVPEFIEPPRVTSATIVRRAIREGDFETFSKFMPASLLNQNVFNWLREKML